MIIWLEMLLLPWLISDSDTVQQIRTGVVTLADAVRHCERLSPLHLQQAVDVCEPRLSSFFLSFFLRSFIGGVSVCDRF